MKERKYEIKVDNSVNRFLCNRYFGFSGMYKEWGGGYCLEVFLAHGMGIGDSSALKWAREIREEFDKHFSENNVDGSLYFSVRDWEKLVDSVIFPSQFAEEGE